MIWGPVQALLSKPCTSIGHQGLRAGSDWEIWDITKCTNIHVYRLPEGEEREKEAGKKKSLEDMYERQTFNI